MAPFFLKRVSFSLILHLLHLYFFTDLKKSIIFRSEYFLQTQATLDFVVTGNIFFPSFLKNDLVNYCFIFKDYEEHLRLPVELSICLLELTLLWWTVKQKQTKRGRLKQEAQHRFFLFFFLFCFCVFFFVFVFCFCNTSIPWAAMLVALEKKIPRQSRKSSNHPSENL